MREIVLQPGTSIEIDGVRVSAARDLGKIPITHDALVDEVRSLRQHFSTDATRRSRGDEVTK